MSSSGSAQRPEGATHGRPNRLVVLAVGFGVAGLIPLFGAYFGTVGCVFALVVVLGHGYSAPQRRAALLALALGAVLAVFWIWFGSQGFI